MEFDNDEVLDDGDKHSKQGDGKPKAWRVEDDSNLEEKDLEKHLFVNSDKKKPVMEGKAMGGHSFNKDNLTTAGDDKNNPSQNGGYTNAYFARTEPSEEHPEDSNFKLKAQDGSPDYSKAQPAPGTQSEASKASARIDDDEKEHIET